MITLSKKNSGFTLIELILVIAIIGIISSTTFVTFNRFSSRQNVNVANDNVKNALNEAKSSALSQVITNCNDAPAFNKELVGYRVRFDSALRKYYIEEVCNPPLSNPIVKTYSLPSKVMFVGSPASISFFSITSQSSGGTVTIKSELSDQQKTINVYTSGVISQSE